MDFPTKDLVFGWHPVLEAIQSGKNISKVWVLQSMQPDRFKILRELSDRYELPLQVVPAEKLNRLVKGNHQGLVAQMSFIEYRSLELLLPALFEEGKIPFLLMLDGVTDVRNLGAIARSAECSGVHALIIPEQGMAPINSDAIKSSAGALLKIPVCRERNLKIAARLCEASGLQVVGVTEKSKTHFYEADFKLPTLLILGNEQKGISSELLKIATFRAAIPMAGQTASLNVSAAAAILCVEVLRQRLALNPNAQA